MAHFVMKIYIHAVHRVNVQTQQGSVQKIPLMIKCVYELSLSISNSSRGSVAAQVVQLYPSSNLVQCEPQGHMPLAPNSLIDATVTYSADVAGIAVLRERD